MIKIICIKWGTKFPAEYVNKLYRGIRDNTSMEFSFVCYTDNENGIITPIEVKPIPYFTGDWYSKIGLYNQELYNPEYQVFYFDLDTVISGNLDEILSYKGDFIILRDFYRPKGMQSALMSWRPTAVNHMWTNYTQGSKYPQGDQAWPEIQYPTADIWQVHFPQQIISYKVHVRDKNIIPNRKRTNHPGTLETSSIVCFHGKPMPHEVKELWIQK